MAKKNAGDILTCDWNPVIGCRRYSEACRRCWFLDGIYPWQQRLGNIPPEARPERPYVFERRMDVEALKPKKGIVGVCQHGDLFWDQVPEETILRALAVVDGAAARRRDGTKYVLWTKRSGRMAAILGERYPRGLPPYLACAVSIEDEEARAARIRDLASIRGTRILVAEPLLGPFAIGDAIGEVEWVVVGSETGAGARPIDLDWVRSLRDEAVGAGLPFFVKQLGGDHRAQERELDGRTWDEFPPGFAK